MIDWEAFKRGEFAVRCDTEDKAKNIYGEPMNAVEFAGSAARRLDGVVKTMDERKKRRNKCRKYELCRIDDHKSVIILLVAQQ